MSSLKLQHLDKIYENNVQAVFDFNLDVNDGELIVLVGPSGCGKSTTLRMVAGLEDISGGKLIIDGKDVTAMPPKDRDIAMVFQNYALYGHMTIYENMAFSLMLRKENKNEIHQKVLAAADILGLTDQLNKKPSQLSGGQRQRVAMGRAIVRTPKVFLFDEPLSNLDAKLRGATRREILADRIVCMSMGHVQQIGTPLELYDSPANLFVAGFIGLPPMNFFDVEVKNGQLVCEDFTEELTADEKAALREYEGRQMTLGVRPENIIEGGNICVRVFSNENLGQTTLVNGTMKKHKITCKFREWCNYKAGDEVMVSFNRKHFFDKETTQAIRLG